MDFYFDFISPFAYLGWKTVHELASRHGRAVQPIPVLFAGLLNHHGQLGPAEVAPKREYIFKLAARRAHDLNLPLEPPPRHPFKPLLGLRLASLPLEEGVRRRLIDDLFDAVWAGGAGIDDADSVRTRLNALGLDGPALIARATAPEIKQAVRDTTAAAITRGVFGVPTVIVDSEPFWGVDSFGDIDRFLRGEDPLAPDTVARWARTPVGAQRPR